MPIADDIVADFHNTRKVGIQVEVEKSGDITFALVSGSPQFQCIFCHNGKKLFRLPVMRKLPNGDFQLTGEAAAHFYSTHGFDPETFLSMIDQVRQKAHTLRENHHER